MALNLSRNTKVFVSSVNGVHADGGQFLTGYISTAGSSNAVGDRIILGNTDSDGVNLYGIVTSVSSGGVTGLAIPGNGSGNGFVVDEEATTNASIDTDGADAGGAGCVVTVKTVGTAGSGLGVTSNGSRKATNVE